PLPEGSGSPVEDQSETLLADDPNRLEAGVHRANALDLGSSQRSIRPGRLRPQRRRSEAGQALERPKDRRVIAIVSDDEPDPVRPDDSSPPANELVVAVAAPERGRARLVRHEDRLEPRLVRLREPGLDVLLP